MDNGDPGGPLERRFRRAAGRMEYGDPGGATAGDDRKMNNEPLEREPIVGDPGERRRGMIEK